MDCNIIEWRSIHIAVHVIRMEWSRDEELAEKGNQRCLADDAPCISRFIGHCGISDPKDILVESS